MAVPSVEMTAETMVVWTVVPMVVDSADLSVERLAASKALLSAACLVDSTVGRLAAELAVS